MKIDAEQAIRKLLGITNEEGSAVEAAITAGIVS